MVIDLSTYRGLCRCGRDHQLLTREILIEKGAVNRLGELVVSLGLEGSGCLICDKNTEPHALRAAQSLAGRLTAPDRVTLDPQGLHADEKAVAALEEQLPAGASWLVAVGSGTIHDATRYVAAKRGLPFLSFPTAASVDGFVSTVCAMTWYGFKKTLPGVAPLAVVADTAIFAEAPYRLTAAGVGDVLGKYTSLLDWRVGSLLTGEPFCQEIYDMSCQAVNKVMDNLQGLRKGDPGAYEELMFALLLSGVAMQMWGDSRPASGVEHHFSHLWEMEVINSHVDALHGEKVGVGLLLAIETYNKLAEISDPASHLIPYAGLPKDLLREKFGRLYDAVMEENQPDLLEELDPARLTACYGDIRELVRSLPDPRALRKAMEEAGCVTTMEDIGLDGALREDSILLSPFVRRRLTLLRVSKLIRWQ